MKGSVQADPPNKEVNKFKGIYFNEGRDEEPLSIKNTIWANTVVATSRVYGLVIYVGKETRIKMNSQNPKTKFGKTDQELDRLSRYLFVIMMAMALTLFVLSGSWKEEGWFIKAVKYLVLLSSIIPISLRVNLDFAKLVYSFRINYDAKLEGTVVRNTAIPEELGRVEYLLSDKTGTLTKNEMVFKQLITEMGNYDNENIEDLKQALSTEGTTTQQSIKKGRKGKKTHSRTKLKDVITCQMLCNNITSLQIQGER